MLFLPFFFKYALDSNVGVYPQRRKASKDFVHSLQRSTPTVEANAVNTHVVWGVLNEKVVVRAPSCLSKTVTDLL